MSEIDWAKWPKDDEGRFICGNENPKPDDCPEGQKWVHPSSTWVGEEADLDQPAADYYDCDCCGWMITKGCGWEEEYC